jgi:hypothetical protein
MCETHHYLPFVKYYVDPSQFEAYREKLPPEITVIKCDEGVQGNLCRVRNWIMLQEFGSGVDVVVLVDDDLKGMYRWEKCVRKRIDPGDFLWWVERTSMLAKDWGAWFWGVNVNQDKQVYREATPFSTLSYIGGPFQVFLKGNDCWYDERLPLKEDYDMTLQHLNKHRIALRLNGVFYVSRQVEQAGGCADFRNREREIEQFNLLQRKWGPDIVKRDRNPRSHSSRKAKSHDDINPLIKVPIKGV